MSKNLFRKGIAVVSIAALGVTGLSVLPASANGMADTSFVSLVPNTGTAYAVLANDVFTMRSNQASPVTSTGRDVKWLVTDPELQVEPTMSSTLASYAIADNTTLSFTIADDIVVIHSTALAAALTTGDVIQFDEDVNADDASDGNHGFTVASADRDYTVTVNKDTQRVSFTSQLDLATLDVDVDAVDQANLDLEVRRSVRASNGSYVVDSGLDTNTSNKVLVLDNTDNAESVSATVTAWVDDNGNDVIDPTEYVSPTRTVQFLLAADIAAVAAFDTLIVGSTSISGTITTTPVLNVDQMQNGDVEARITYQGNANNFDVNATRNLTTSQWTFTRERSVNITDIAKSSTTFTVTGNGHGFTPGETVIIAGSAGSNDGTYVVATADTNTFTYTRATGGATDAADQGTAKIAVVGGAYSVKAKIGTSVKTAVSGSVSAAVAADGKTASPSGNNTKVTVNGTDDAAIAVRYDTKAVAATFSFLNADGGAVPAGRPVVITVGISDATGVTVNGTARTNNQVVNAVTNASGQVEAAVTTTSGNANDVITLTAVAEGQSASSTSATFTWTATVYVLHDLNSNSSSLHRNVAAGGSNTFNFAVLDNWAVTPATGSYRLNVALTGNTVSTTNVAMTAGRASVTVADSGLSTGNVQAVVTPQIQAADGTWGVATTATNAAAVTFQVVPATQTAAVSANMANSPVTLNTAALVAGDERISQLDVTGATGATLSGVVTDSLNGTVKPGAAVTISGPSTLLFISDLGGSRDFASFGSIRVFADANGAYSVRITSNRSQVDSVVTVAAMGASKTAKVTIGNPTADTTGAGFTVSAPKSIKEGRTLVMTGTLVDKFGNPVAAGATYFRLSYSGPGFVASQPTTLDATGSFSVRILVGANDRGPALLTASYDSNTFTVDNVAGTTVAVSQTIATWVGPIANAKAGVKKGRVIVEAYRAKGKTVSVFVGSTRVASFVADKANFRAVVRGINSGTRNVSVRLSGPGDDFRGAITVK